MFTAAINKRFRPLLQCYLKLKRINWPGIEKKSTTCSEPARKCWGQCIQCLERARQCLGQPRQWFGRAREILFFWMNWAREILFRRWSESISQYNLIDYCLKERPKKNATGLFDCFGRTWIGLIKIMDLKDWYDQMKYVTKKRFTEELWNFIFEQLKKKSDLGDDPDTAKKICSARGEWVLQNTEGAIDSSNLMHYIRDVDYDQSLILWHIATDLCYYNSESPESDDDSKNRREICKMLSDYMLYLLIMQPTMMSAVAGIGEIRFRDT